MNFSAFDAIKDPRRESSSSTATTSSAPSVDSLASFSSADGGDHCCAHEEHTNSPLLSKKEAIILLLDRLRKFRPSSEGGLNVSATGTCSFDTSGRSGKNGVEIDIQDDVKSVVVSTVIHQVNPGHNLSSSATSKNRSKASSPGAYSFMTRMMKYNAILSRDRSHGFGHIAAQNGVFIFFVHINISALLVDERLEACLENTLLKATEMSLEFEKVARRHDKDKQKHLRRRRLLVGAYNMTVL